MELLGNLPERVALTHYISRRSSPSGGAFLPVIDSGNDCVCRDIQHLSGMEDGPPGEVVGVGQYGDADPGALGDLPETLTGPDGKALVTPRGRIDRCWGTATTPDMEDFADLQVARGTDMVPAHEVVDADAGPLRELRERVARTHPERLAVLRIDRMTQPAGAIDNQALSDSQVARGTDVIPAF